MLVRGSLIVIYGPSNCGKLVGARARDVPRLRASVRRPQVRAGADELHRRRGHRRVHEATAGVERRTHPSAQGSSLNDLELYPGPVSLLEETQVDKLIDDILSMPERPTALFVDTLARSFAGGDENTAEDMNEFVAACDLIREETGVAVVVIHHTGQGQEG